MANEIDIVHALVSFEGHLISGHDSGMLRVWDVVTGECCSELEGHKHADVVALSASWSRLASGSDSMLIRVWGMMAGAKMACNRSLLGHSGRVVSLAGWQNKVASGSSDGNIRVWDAQTGTRDTTLFLCSGAVSALVFHGDRLFSASSDKKIRSWAVGTWVLLRTVVAYGPTAKLYPCCLTVSGSKLVSGSKADPWQCSEGEPQGEL